MPVPKQFFRSHNLIVTIAPPMVAGRPACPIPTVCPSGTCCGPPSRAFECYYSQLLPLPPELSPDDLRTILQEMRDKLKVEDRGLAILLGTESNKTAAAWQKVVEDQGLRSFTVDAEA